MRASSIVKTNSSFRAQASLETLLILASLLGVLMVFSPVISKVSDLSKYVVLEKQTNFEIEKIFCALEEANALGIGSLISGEIFFQTNVTFKTIGRKIVAEYALFGRKKRIEREILGAEIELPLVLNGKKSFIAQMGAKGPNLQFQTIYG